MNNKVWIVLENVFTEYENKINVYSSYEKAKENFEKLKAYYIGYYSYEMENKENYTQSKDYLCINNIAHIELYMDYMDRNINV